MKEKKYIINTKSGRGNYIYNFEELNVLVSVLLEIKNEKEINEFIVDLFTPREIADITKRFLVGYLITQGANFKYLEDKCGVSPNTVSQLRKKIYFGTGKLRKILESVQIKRIEKDLRQFIKDDNPFPEFNKKPVIYGHKFPKQ